MAPALLHNPAEFVIGDRTLLFDRPLLDHFQNFQYHFSRHRRHSELVQLIFDRGLPALFSDDEFPLAFDNCLNGIVSIS